MKLAGVGGDIGMIDKTNVETSDELVYVLIGTGPPARLVVANNLDLG